MTKRQHIFLESCTFILIACSTVLHAESPKQPEALCTLARECFEAQLKNVKLVETNSSLSRDLNIKDIAQSMQCTTQIGNTVLETMLRNPLHPEEMHRIQNRQAIIRSLSENPELLTKIKTLLESARDHESNANKLFDQTSPGANLERNRPIMNKVIFAIAKWINTSRMGMACAELGTISSLLGCAGGIGMGAWKTRNFLQKNNTLEAGIALGKTTIIAAITAWNCSGTYQQTKQALDIKTSVRSLEKLFTAAEAIDKMRAGNNLSTECSLQSIDKRTVNAFQGDYLSHIYPQFSIPKALRAYENQKAIAHLLAFIGEVDAYHSVAQKIASSQSGKNSFCFSQFNKESEPRIDMKGFWNALVNNAVPNDLSESKNMIVTGANAGGKTTAIRAILQNLVLSQSLGVAAAKECSITPFSTIHSYLNVSDDLIGGLSLFASEIKRAKEIAEKIRSLKHDDKFFFALDELFTGTNAEDGSECAYNFIKALSENPKTQCIYATHFKELTELADLKGIRCANYTVGTPSRQSDGSLRYPFTLIQGAGKTRFGVDMARHAGLFEKYV